MFLCMCGFPLQPLILGGNAELWLQTYEAHHSIDNWPKLCVAVEKKFGQDLYHNYMRDLLSIRQTDDVLEYAGRFETAKHRVLVHNKEIGEVLCSKNLRWLEVFHKQSHNTAQT